MYSSSMSLGGKALLEKADRHFRLCQFDVAFKTCDEAIKSSDFTASWKDKKRHEVIKTYIVYGRQSGKCAPCAAAVALRLGLAHSARTLKLFLFICRSQSVLKWLIENKEQLVDYPLYICEWYVPATGQSFVAPLLCAVCSSCSPKAQTTSISYAPVIFTRACLSS